MRLGNDSDPRPQRSGQAVERSRRPTARFMSDREYPYRDPTNTFTATHRPWLRVLGFPKRDSPIDVQVLGSPESPYLAGHGSYAMLPRHYGHLSQQGMDERKGRGEA